MSDEKIQVREGWWRQRCGNVVRIISDDGPVPYRWVDNAGDVYSDTGRYAYNWDHPRDLVEYLGKNITITSAEYVDARPTISHAICDGCNTELPSNVQRLCPECAKTLDALSEYVKQRSEVSRER